MKLFVQSALIVLVLGISTIIAPIAQAQNSTTAPPAQGQKLTPEQQAKAAEVSKILNDDQKKQLQIGLAEGKDMKDILPTLNLSRAQKMELLKLKN
jgi:hypothetical protein